MELPIRTKTKNLKLFIHFELKHVQESRETLFLNLSSNNSRRDWEPNSYRSEST